MNGAANGRKKKLKINSSIERDTSNLPHDIIPSILSRLPVQSLLKFKCVSKPWYALISDSKFARFHLLQSQKNSNSGTLYVSRHDPFYFLKFTNLNLELQKLKFPIKRYRDIICSCDGLIILRNGHNSMLVIWNPSTRTYTRFQSPNEIDYGRTPLYGLCFDESADDYKFVLLISNSVYIVYSCKNNSWSNKKDLPLECKLQDHIVLVRRSGLFVNGALHWVTTKSRNNFDSSKEGELLQLYKKHCTDCGFVHFQDCPVYECNYDYTYELCCFDPKDENFKKFSKPSCFDDSSVFQLTDLGGQLCLYRNTYDFKTVNIWMMKDYGDFNSWINLLTIENIPSTCGSFRSVRPLCLTNKSDVVLWINNINHSRLVVYNSKENILREMQSSGEDKRIGKWLRQGKMRLDPFLCWTNSLVFPNRIKN